MSETADALVAAGREYPGVRVFEGEPHELLALLAEEHAARMASTGRQGHQGWPGRFSRIAREMGLKGTEICAESWYWRSHDPLETIGAEMFHSWQQSSGHWSVASSPHRYWGAGMARSRRGIWYACVIVAD